MTKKCSHKACFDSYDVKPAYLHRSWSGTVV